MVKKAPKFKAGDYDTELLNFLGEDILRECVKESDIAIETAQRLIGEVRTKGLATVGILSTFVVALFVASYEIACSSMAFRICCLCLMAIFGYGIIQLFGGIIYNKENQNGGSTLSYLLNQETLNGLSAVNDGTERTRLFLFYCVGRKESACNAIDEETGRMQSCYKRTMTIVSFGTLLLLILYALVCLLCRA